ncbi:MAG: CaiB/BaiF CoA transferase family protein [Candidatus Binataceae bacterium]
MSEPIRPLDDLRVLDLTHYYNGPYATLLLSYLGAEVIKIESPHHGDGMRALYRKRGQPFGTPFALMNANKRSITLNLKSAEGKEIFKRLVRDADLVVENYAPGTMESYGLGYEALREVNPRLLYACGTGYGISGPNRELAAFDPVVQAMSGIMAVTGERDGPPLKAGPAVVDILGAVHLCAGMLAAIRQRDRTGKGLMVELSLNESSIPSLTTHLGALAMGLTQFRDGNRASGGVIVPYNAYPASDGWVMILSADNTRWATLCRLMGQPELSADPRFATMSARSENRDEVDRMVGAWTRAMTRQQIMDLLSKNDVFCGIVKELPEVMADPHLHQRGTLLDIEHPQLGPMTIFTSPLRLNGEANVPTSPSPMLGADNEAFYGALGFSAEQIAGMRERKVI